MFLDLSLIEFELETSDLKLALYITIHKIQLQCTYGKMHQFHVHCFFTLTDKYTHEINTTIKIHNISITLKVSLCVFVLKFNINVVIEYVLFY